jgi:two-component system, OmpR family, alkaline phosphatase synthesis response regulator PhoP
MAAARMLSDVGQVLMKKRVLLIEDDKAIARVIQDNLAFEGFEVAWSERGDDAIRVANQFLPDLVLLDLMLPSGFDGFELCRYFSQSPKRVPVIILSARAQKEDRVRGLTLGADDYVVKPFALDELLARINAVLRRTTKRISQIRLGKTTIDFVRLQAFNGKHEVVFTQREFDILRYLGEHAGSIVSRDELLCAVWGYSEAPLTRTVDSFIFRLRHKIEADPRHPKYIIKAYGGGYQLMLDS